MASNFKTRRDLIGDKIADIFTGRQDELISLVRALNDPKSVGFVNIFGISGIGKTFLVNKFVDTARSQSFLSCSVDLAFCSSRISLLNKLSQSLTAPFLPDADNACLSIRKRYRDIHVKLQAAGTLTASALAHLSRLSDFDGEIVETGMQLGNNTLGHNDIILAQGALGPDYQFFRDPTPELARALVLDMNRLCGTRPPTSGIMIALDRSEKVEENLLIWFRDHCFYDFSQNVVLIISGQRRLTDGWDDLLQLGLSIELKPLSGAETAALAAKLGANTQEARDWVYEASGGVPLFATTLCRAYAQDSSIIEQDPQTVSPPESVMERYFSAIAPDQREIVMQGAILRYVSRENAEAVFGLEATALLFAILKQLNFITETANGFVIHDRVRDYLNRYFAKQSPSRFIALSTSAADYYRACANRGARAFEYTREELYHRVRSGHQIGLENLKEAFDNHSLLNEPQECEALVSTAVQAGLEASDWSNFFRAVILYQRAAYRDSHSILGELIADVTLSMEQELRGLVLFYYSVTSWYLCEFPDSLVYATQAVETLEAWTPQDPQAQQRKAFHLNRAIGIIGLTQDRLGLFTEGLSTVGRMATKARAAQDLTSLGYALNSSGYFSWHEGHWRDADMFLGESITVWGQLQSDFGACYPLGHRAALRYLIGDPGHGIEAARGCLRLCAESANKEMECKSTHNLAEMLWAMGRFEECVEAAEQTESLAEAIGQQYFLADVIRVKALGCVCLGDRDAAAAALERSLALSAQMGARYLRARTEAIAFAAGMAPRLKLPEFEFVIWAREALNANFGRAILDYGRVAARIAGGPSGFGSLVVLRSERELPLLLASALRLNMNAFLLLTRELIEHGYLTLDSIDELRETLIEEAMLHRDPSEATFGDLISRSAARGIREGFNAMRWDEAVARLAAGGTDLRPENSSKIE